MYRSSLRHIHDPVLLPLKVEVICYINFMIFVTHNGDVSPQRTLFSYSNHRVIFIEGHVEVNAGRGIEWNENDEL